MIYAAESANGWFQDIATIVSVVVALAIVLVIAGLLLTGRIRIAKFSLKDLSVEMVGPGSGQELADAIAAISDPLTASNYVSYGANIVKAASVPSQLDALYVDITGQPGWLTSRLFFFVVLWVTNPENQTPEERQELEGLKKLFPPLGNWLDKIANDFRGRSSNGRTEGLNHGLRTILWRAYGMANFQNFRLRVLHCFGLGKTLNPQNWRRATLSKEVAF